MTDTATPSAPAGPFTAATATDRLVSGIGDDFDLDADPEEGAEPTHAEKPAKPKAKPKSKPENEQRSSLEESDFEDAPSEASNTPRPHDPEPGEGEEAQAHERPDKPEKPQFGPKDRGTRDKPLTEKDLPDDRFIKLRINGKEEVVSMRDAVKGFIAKQTFDRVYSQVNANAEKVLQLGNQAIEERERIRDELQSFLTNPEKMLGWCMKYAPEVADQFAMRYATEYLQKWREKPELKMQFEHERKLAQLREQQQTNEQQHRDWERHRAMTERTAEKKALLAPGYHEGMKLAGFPKATAEFQDTVKALLSEVSKRRELTPEDVRTAVVRTAQLLKSPTVQDRRPAPVSNTPREPAPTSAKPNGKGKDWSEVPYAQRVRSTDYFLQGLRR